MKGNEKSESPNVTEVPHNQKSITAIDPMTGKKRRETPLGKRNKVNNAEIHQKKIENKENLNNIEEIGFFAFLIIVFKGFILFLRFQYSNFTFSINTIVENSEEERKKEKPLFIKRVPKDSLFFQTERATTINRKESSFSIKKMIEEDCRRQKEIKKAQEKKERLVEHLNQAGFFSMTETLIENRVAINTKIDNGNEEITPKKPYRQPKSAPFSPIINTGVKTIRISKEGALKKVKDNGLFLEALPLGLRNDFEVALTALANNWLAIKFIPESLQKKEACVKAVLKQKPEAFEHFFMDMDDAKPYKKQYPYSTIFAFDLNKEKIEEKEEVVKTFSRKCVLC